MRDESLHTEITRVKDSLTQHSHLSHSEIDEYIRYQFKEGPKSVKEQVHRYFLIVKIGSPRKAQQLLKETRSLIKKSVTSEQQVHDLCLILSRYISGIIVEPDLTPEMKMELDQKFSLPLKTLTVKARKPYQVWCVSRRHHSQTVQWKAWRQGRPTILGYGMTEQEAIDDLRYNVQPDHNGTLDGLGTPDGPIIGGNMFSPNEIVRNNKSRSNRK